MKRPIAGFWRTLVEMTARETCLRVPPGGYAPWDVREVAKVVSQISAVLAGFALTIAVFLLQGGAGHPSQSSQQAILVFFGAFLHAMFASMFIANIAGDADPDTAYLRMVGSSFPFTVSIILLMLGMRLLFEAYQVPGASGLALCGLALGVLISIGGYTNLVARMAYRSQEKGKWLAGMLDTLAILVVACTVTYELSRGPGPIPTLSPPKSLTSCLLISAFVAIWSQFADLGWCGRRIVPAALVGLLVVTIELLQPWAVF